MPNGVPAIALAKQVRNRSINLQSVVKHLFSECYCSARFSACRSAPPSGNIDPPDLDLLLSPRLPRPLRPLREPQPTVVCSGAHLLPQGFRFLLVLWYVLLDAPHSRFFSALLALRFDAFSPPVMRYLKFGPHPSPRPSRLNVWWAPRDAQAIFLRGPIPSEQIQKYLLPVPQNWRKSIPEPLFCAPTREK